MQLLKCNVSFLFVSFPGLYLASYESESPENQVEKDRWKALRCVGLLRWDMCKWTCSVAHCRHLASSQVQRSGQDMRHRRQLTPPASEGARVLIALIWTVKEPSWYFGVCCFVWFCFVQKKKNDLGDRKKTWWTGFIRNVLEPASNKWNWNKMPLQRCEVSVSRPACWGATSPPPDPSYHCVYSVEICLLLERVQLQGKPLSKIKFLLMLFVDFVFCSSATFSSPSFSFTFYL